MPVAPDTRLIKIALTALAGLVAALVAAVAIASPAGAQPGVRGRAYERGVHPAAGGAAQGDLQLTVAGFAYNPESSPVQAVRATVYGQQQRGGRRHRLYTSGAHLADGTHYDARHVDGQMSTAERAYTFAWSSVPFAASAADGRVYPYVSVCISAHDAGSHAGFTKIDKCRPAAQTSGIAS